MRIINLQIATFSMKYTSIGPFQFLKKKKKKFFSSVKSKSKLLGKESKLMKHRIFVMSNV